MVHLLCLPTEIRDNGLIRWNLWLVNGDRRVDRVNVYSGAPSAQILNSGSSDYPGSLRPIPPGKYRLGPIEYRAEGWGPGIGQYWVDLLPIAGTRTYGRSGFGLHLDSNYHTPNGRGSAGCIVTPHQRDLDRILGWLRSQARPTYLEVHHTLDIGEVRSKYTVDRVRRAWLELISWCEGTSGPDGYRVCFTGVKFDGFQDHPRKVHCAGRLCSDAAGKYQFLSSTWDECRKALQLPDFSPDNQDQAALYLIDRRGALENIDKLQVANALDKLSWEWASLPNSRGIGRYGQPVKTLDQINAKLSELLKK
nr:MULTISPECIES: glycoside hydrolase family 104 protein [unclassified Thermosynechococcus]